MSELLLPALYAEFQLASIYLSADPEKRKTNQMATKVGFLNCVVHLPPGCILGQVLAKVVRQPINDWQLLTIAVTSTNHNGRNLTPRQRITDRKLLVVAVTSSITKK